MSPELIGILSVGVALAALILTSTGRLRNDLGAQIAALGDRVGALEVRIGALEARTGALEQRMARLEGLLEGAGLYRPAAVPEPRPAVGAAEAAAGD